MREGAARLSRPPRPTPSAGPVRVGSFSLPANAQSVAPMQTEGGHTGPQMVADTTVVDTSGSSCVRLRSNQLAVEHAGIPVLHAPSGLDVAERRVEAQVLGHALVGVEHDLAQPLGAGVILRE